MSLRALPGMIPTPGVRLVDIGGLEDHRKDALIVEDRFSRDVLEGNAPATIEAVVESIDQ